MNPVAVLSILAALLVSSGCVQERLGADVEAKGLRYLEAQQLANGGWSAAPGGPSDFSTTCWVVLGLVAGGGDPNVLDRARAHLVDWADNVSRDDTGSFSAVNALALYVLAGLALGVQDADWAETKPLSRLEAMASNSSLALNEKIFLLGTLGRAGRVEAVQDLRSQIDGMLGGGNATDVGADAWFRSLAILAMLASGTDAEDQQSRQWARSLLPFQKEESGFRSRPEYEPDASTTAAVLTVLSKIRFIYSHERGSAVEFLQGLQQPEGWVRFSEEYDFGRAKTTSETILGTSGRGVFGV